MKNLNYKSWVSAIFICVACLALPTVANAKNDDKKSAFDCMDKESFKVNQTCMAEKIASHDNFENKQNQIVENIASLNDMAMATMIFDNRNMTIRIIAHKDAAFAKVNSDKIK